MLDNQTAYGAERNWTRDKHGMHHWIVAVQATFEIAPDGALRLADVQDPPSLEPEYRGDPASTSLRRDSELLSVKPGTDVIVDAHAHAPEGRPTPAVPVALRVARAIDKRLMVFGSRTYLRGLTGVATSKPLPFVTTPIHYESAFGGGDLSHPDPTKRRLDVRNPVGKGFAVRSDSASHELAHSVEYLEGDVSKRGPAGFGPIAPHWSPRVRLAGTYDGRWEATKRPLLPDDYDDRFAHSAPVDQQFAQPLRGGESIELVHLTPQQVLRLELPKISLELTTVISGRKGGPQEQPVHLSSVIVLADQMRLVLVWQSSLRVNALEADYLDQTRIVERRGVA